MRLKLNRKLIQLQNKVDPDRAQELWSKLILEQNKFASSDSKFRTELFLLINEYHDVFTSDQCKVGNTSWVKFKIELNPPNLLSKKLVLYPPLKVNLKFQLDDWLCDSVIALAKSPWASRLVPVKKKNRKVPWAPDFCVLKSLTVHNSFPTPNISEVLETLSESKVFSTLDV